MKLNLKCGKNIKNGYLNIDIFDIDNIPKEIYNKGDYLNLDWVCDNSSIQEIVTNDAISNTSLDNISNVFENWYSKLMNGGRLYLQIIDIYTVSRLFQFGQIDLNEMNQAVFNDNRKCVLDKYTIFPILTECGFTIETFSYDGIYLDVWMCKK